MTAPLRDGEVLTPLERKRFYSPSDLRSQAAAWRGHAARATGEAAEACARHAALLDEAADMLAASRVMA